jgi:enoyl-CoA hydratase/carnithine racemase
MRELGECVDAAAGDDGARAVIFRSALDRFFSAGVDIKAFNANTTEENMESLLPGNGGTQRLPRLIGATRALDLMVTGRRLSPAEAYELGILDRLFPAEQLEVETLEYAESLAAGAAGAIGAIKLAVHRGMNRPLDEGLEVERELVEPLFEGEEAREGLQAFMEKRRPEFSK